MFTAQASNHSAPAAWPAWGQTVTATAGGVDAVPEGCVVKQAAGVVPWDNQHNLISKEVATAFRFATAVLTLPLCFFLSVCTNLLNMVVFYKHGLKERVNVCLFSLAILDLLNVAFIYGVNASAPYMFSIGKGNALSPSAVFFFNSHLVGLISLATGSQVLSAVIAMERCLCISRPLLAKHLLSAKKTAVVLWLVLLALIAIGYVGDGFRLKIRCVFDAEANSVYYQFFHSRFYVENMQMIHVLAGIIYGLIIPTLCVFCVTVCTVVIVVKMKSLSLWREAASSASEAFTSRDLAVTRMIVGTSVLFIVCMVPNVMFRIAVNLVPGLAPGGRYQNSYSVIQRVYNFTTTINSTVNFFVYYACGTRFRQTAQQLVLSFVKCRICRSTKG